MSLCKLNVYCPNCTGSFDYHCEWEDAGEGSEHEKECFTCKSIVSFEINYYPSADNESIKSIDEDNDK
jgi:hypothetical protein